MSGVLLTDPWYPAGWVYGRRKKALSVLCTMTLVGWSFTMESPMNAKGCLLVHEAH